MASAIPAAIRHWLPVSMALRIVASVVPIDHEHRSRRTVSL